MAERYQNNTQNQQRHFDALAQLKASDNVRITSQQSGNQEMRHSHSVVLSVLLLALGSGTSFAACTAGQLTTGGIVNGHFLTEQYAKSDCVAVVNANTAHLNTLQAIVDGQQAQIDTIFGNVTVNGQTIGTLQTVAANHEVRITTLEGTVSGQGFDIGTLQAWQATLNGSASGGSIQMSDGTGNTTSITPARIVLSDGVHSSTIGPDGMTLIGSTFTVTDGSGDPTKTTTVTDGDVTVGNSVTVGQTTVTRDGGVTTNQLVVAGRNIGTWADSVDDHLTALDRGVLANQQAINSLQTWSTQQVARLDGRVDKAYEGVAIALAMESPQVDPGKHFGLSINYGNFEGENAAALAARIRFDNTFSFTAGAGIGNSGTIGVRAGAQVQW